MNENVIRMHKLKIRNLHVCVLYVVKSLFNVPITQRNSCSCTVYSCYVIADKQWPGFTGSEGRQTSRHGTLHCCTQEPVWHCRRHCQSDGTW